MPKKKSRRRRRKAKAEEKNPHQDCNWAGDVKIPLVISLAYQKARTRKKSEKLQFRLRHRATFTSGMELWETR